MEYDLKKMRYGLAMQAYREQRGWSQRELAERLGYENGAMISTIEQGNHFPSMEKAFAVAELFQTTIDAMCAFDGDLPLPGGAVLENGELLVPASRGTIHLRGWSLEDTLQILRTLKDVGVLFYGETMLPAAPGDNGPLGTEDAGPSA